MIFRTYFEGLIYVVEAPEGSKLVLDDDGAGELVFFDRMTSGAFVERRLPTSVVVKAARRESFGLKIVEERQPADHPEAASRCARN